MVTQEAQFEISETALKEKLVFLEIASIEFPDREIGGYFEPICKPITEPKNPSSEVIGWKTWVTLAAIALMFVGLTLNLYSSYYLVFLTMVFLLVCGIITIDDALYGFSNEGMITIAVLFAVVHPISKNRGLMSLAKYAFGRKTKWRSISVLRIILPTATLSMFLNNTPIVALFIPLIKEWCKTNMDHSSKYLLALSFGVIMGGMCTLIGTSTNLVVNGMMKEYGVPELGFFEIGYAALPLAAMGVLYLITIGTYLSPTNKDEYENVDEVQRNFIFQLEINRLSKWKGKTVKKLKESSLIGKKMVDVQEVIRQPESAYAEVLHINPVTDDEIFEDGDLVLAHGTIAQIIKLFGEKKDDKKKKKPEIDLVEDDDEAVSLVSPTPSKFSLNAKYGTLVRKWWKPNKIESLEYFEVILSSQNPAIGKKVRDAPYSILAVRRHGLHVNSDLNDIVLKSGDALLIVEKESFGKKSTDSEDFYSVTQHETPESPDAYKVTLFGRTFNLWWYSYLCIPIFIGMIVAATLNIPMIVCALTAASLVILFGFIKPSEAIKCVDWPLLVLIGASFGLGRAVSASGLAYAFATLVRLFKLPPFFMPGFVFLLCEIISSVITNNACVAIFFPVSIKLAQELGLNARTFSIAVALGASSNFWTPIGYQTNMMVQGPGGYKFIHYVIVGLPLQLIYTAGVTGLLPVIYGV